LIDKSYPSPFDAIMFNAWSKKKRPNLRIKMGSKYGIGKHMENQDDAILMLLREKLEVYTT